MSGDNHADRRPNSQAHDSSADGAGGTDPGTSPEAVANNLAGGTPSNPLTGSPIYANPGNPNSGLIGPGSDQDKINQLNAQIAAQQLAIAQLQGLSQSALQPYQHAAQQAAAQQALAMGQWAKARQMALQAMQNQALYGYAYLKNVFAEPERKKIPDAGITVGEITGWRAWLIDPFWPNCLDKWLQSVTASVSWNPDEPMKGDPTRIYEGIHAFKTLELLNQNMPYGRYVLGTIKMWGVVIEHEQGYRAELAKVSSIISVPFDLRTMSGHKLRRLRQMYGVGAEPKP